MSDIKKSTLLAQLKEASLSIGKAENPPFTAERFLVAAIEKVWQTPASDQSLELGSVKMKLEQLKDLTSARDALLSYINERSISFLDEIYMKKRYGEACAAAVTLGTDTITAVMLLDHILKNPSDFIAPLLRKDSGPAEEPSAPSPINPSADAVPNSDKGKNGEKQPVSGSPVVVKHEMSELVADVKRIRSELLESVHGQDNAVHVFSTGYFQACLLSKIDKKRSRPKATFLFAGPPGVGKTFLAEKAAEALKLPFMRFDMSEYADKEANLEFCGSDKVYKNSKVGNVTGFVAENPRCVLLFDEIEKAHLCVIHLFLQMLDAGRLRDNYTDREVSFSDAIIILTTNAGKQLYEESENGDFSAVSRKVIVRALQTDMNPATNTPYFPGALCSRFASGNVVMFNHMGAHDLRTIARKEILRQANNLHVETGIRMEIDPKVYTALIFAEGSAADARTVRSRAESFFNNELYELLRLVASEKVSSQVDAIETVSVDLDLSRASAEIKALFEPQDPEKILVFAADETVERCRRAVPDLRVEGVSDLPSAVASLQRGDVEFVLLDMRFGACTEEPCSLNIEDVNSPARDFFRFLREQGGGIPVYLIENQDSALSEEEKISFLRQGVRGTVTPFVEEETFSSQMAEIAEGLYQQESMIKLSKENKVVSFETAQSVSEDGKQAVIRLFDLALSVAVDSEDAKSVLSSVSKPHVRFDEVIGAQDAKKELAYFVEYLRNPKKYMGTGVKAPKGVLLYGPPGTGKTLLAKAMASESGVTFIAAEGNQFLKRYVGEGPQAVHDLFKTARKYAPSILFIDEIDAIARNRGSDGGTAEVSAATLTSFLTEMDGFVSDPSKPVFVLAATNYDVEQGTSRSLDPALLRRFDRRVCIDLPKREDRILFLRKKFSSNPAFDVSDAEIETLAMRSTGMSLADLDSAAELALRSAIRDGSVKVSDAIMEEAFETFNSGEEKKWDASLLQRVARHEAGHAFLCWESGETPSYLTIVARGDHGGYMRHADQEGKAIHTKDELLARIRTSLGGRAAELVYYGERDGLASGASGDLRNATAVARRIVCSYGMDEEFGLAVVHTSLSDSGPMSQEVRNAVNRILNEQLQLAIRLISENKDKIDALVDALMARNHLTDVEIEAVLGNKNNG